MCGAGEAPAHRSQTARYSVTGAALTKSLVSLERGFYYFFFNWAGERMCFNLSSENGLHSEQK